MLLFFCSSTLRSLQLQRLGQLSNYSICFVLILFHFVKRCLQKKKRDWLYSSLASNMKLPGNNHLSSTEENNLDTFVSDHIIANKEAVSCGHVIRLCCTVLICDLISELVVIQDVKTLICVISKARKIRC